MGLSTSGLFVLGLCGERTNEREANSGAYLGMSQKPVIRLTTPKERQDQIQKMLREQRQLLKEREAEHKANAKSRQ